MVRSVDLPNPAGAETSVSLPLMPSLSRSCNLWRGTMPGRGQGTYSLLSNKPVFRPFAFVESPFAGGPDAVRFFLGPSRTSKFCDELLRAMLLLDTIVQG